MPVIRLTKREVDALPDSERPTIYYDRDLKGFGLKVQPSGARSWVVEYRPGVGSRGVAKRRVVLGSASVLTAEQARAKAKDILAGARLGDDEAADRSESRRGVTFAELADAFLSEHVEARRKPATLASYKKLLAVARPPLGSAKAASLTTADIAKLHLSLRKTPYSANRVIAVMASMFTFAGKRGLVPKGFNPTSGIERYREQGRERYLTGKELETVGEALREAETVGIEWQPVGKPLSKHVVRAENRRTILSPYATAAIRLLLLTGCRLREILHLRWREIDFERGLIFLPDSKTGRKTIVLNTAALAVLGSLKRAGEFVIAGEAADKPRADLNKPWRLVARRAGLEGLRIHDLRHSFASVGAGGGHGLPVIGKLLGHAQASTTQRYAHLDADPLRRVSNAIGDHISSAMGESRGED